MENLAGLIVTLVMVFIGSSISKKAAEKSTPQPRRTTTKPDPYHIELGDTYEVPEKNVEEDAKDGSIQRIFETLEEVSNDKEESQSQFGERISKTSVVNVEGRSIQRKGYEQIDVKKYDLAQAIIVSEIIRKPRALRPWPHR
ncbi:MAG: hypothetical protein QM401_03965 [Bacillota bacterium]|nr:hypothetical protein [Bacillota bacterium]HHU60346.1 hypothetical protein [Natronincola sp.]